MNESTHSKGSGAHSAAYAPASGCECNEVPCEHTGSGLDWQTEDAIERNARSMKPKEYAWLKRQGYQPPIRRALIAAYERIHGAKP